MYSVSTRNGKTNLFLEITNRKVVGIRQEIIYLLCFKVFFQMIHQVGSISLGVSGG